MLGPLRCKFRALDDPAGEFPITLVVDIKKGGVSNQDVKHLSQVIRQHGVHLAILLTDVNPKPEVLEELEFLPQIILVVTELRQLVRLLVISFARNRGIPIDSSLLQKAYSDIFDKLGLREQIIKWVERMRKQGYLLRFEGFVGDTVKACRFFINSMGKDLTLEKCWEYSWNIRKFLPFGIESEIIPDMGLGPLKKHAKVLVDYGFLRETDEGKYKLIRHPSEERVTELLQDYYGGSTSKDSLAKHFIYREAAERVFDSLISHMQRKFLVTREARQVIRYLKLPEIKRMRDDSVEQFESWKSDLKRNYPFTHILTWKEREWNIISMNEMENFIEKILQEISIETDEDVIRSSTFLVIELINWYGQFVSKINRCMMKAQNIVGVMESDVKNLEQRFEEILRNFVVPQRTTELKIELQELQRVKEEINELRNLLEHPLPLDEIERKVSVIAGSKRSRDVSRKEKLTTDVDEELRAQGVRGDWTVVEYLLLKSKQENIKGEIEKLAKIVDSLTELSSKLSSLNEEIVNLFKD